MKAILEKRKALIELSAALKPICTKQNIGINEAIRQHIISQKPGVSHFETFEGWAKKGFKVKKGEKAHPVWSRAITPPEEEMSNVKYYRVAFLFDNLQVEPKNN